VPLGFAIDWMHNTHLNVVKSTLMKLWFDPKHKNDPYYIGTNEDTNKINEGLTMVKCPDEVNSIPANILEYKHWKGNKGYIYRNLTYIIK